MNAEERAKLIEQARMGDGNAFQSLFELARPQLERYARRLLGDQESSEDIVQGTAARGFVSITLVREGPFHFTSWLYAIAGNLARDELRQRKSRMTFSLEERAERYNAQHGGDGYISGDYISASKSVVSIISAGQPTVSDPADIYEQHESLKELRQSLAKAIDTLDPRGAEALMRRAEGQSYEEIAESMGLRWTQVKSVLERARQQARIHMAKK